ncbi:MAG: hypothetical protein LUO93_06860 [Methanomicrobiales archaeon]|nr:hypothetical protein [Methanomicrobiales archaeon]
MAEYEISDESQVGVLVRTRIRQYEEKHPGVAVYVSDIRGVWDIRFTWKEGRNTSGTAYISVPEAVGWIARMRWPPGEKADVAKIDYQSTAGLEGFILAAMRFEEEGSG